MTEPPAENREPGTGGEPLDFDPYRFGKPDYYIPPEYAPPGYQPPEQFRAPPPSAIPPPPPSPGTPGYVSPTRPDGPVWPPQEPPQQGAYLPHPPPPPPGWGQYGAARPATGGKARTAMILGILAVCFFWLTLLDLALAIPAIVLGAMALRDSKRSPERVGRNQALTGLICGIMSVVLIITTVVVVFVRVKPCLQYGVYSDRYNSCVNDRL